MVTLQDIERVAHRIAEEVRAERVILFGSHARGAADEQSDVDLLVVVESDEPPFKRSRPIYKLFRPHPFAMDVIVYTPEELEEQAKTPLSFAATVLREGKVVYDRRK